MLETTAFGAAALAGLAAGVWKSPQELAQHFETDTARAFTRAYAAAREFLNQAPAAEITALQQPYFPGVSAAALESCISSYQRLGCWTPHVEITRPAFEVILDIFEYTGGITERYPYEMVCASPPV